MSLNRRRMMMQAKEHQEFWNYEWDYTMGAPDTTLWDYPVGGGLFSFEDGEGLYLYSWGSLHAGLRFKDCAAWFGQKSVYEVEVKVLSVATNGFRIICTGGENGVSDSRGLQVTINGGYLNIIRGSNDLSTINADAPVNYNEWHKVRLELNTDANANKVYLDDSIISTVTNENLSTNYATSVWCLTQYGKVYVRSVKYRKED